MWNHIASTVVMLLWMMAPGLGLCASPGSEQTPTILVITARSGLQRSQAIAYAYKHNPSLRVFQSRIRRAWAQVKGSQIYPNNPVLSGSGGIQTPDTGSPTSPTSPATVLPRASATLSLALPVGGRWTKKQRWARAQLQRLQAELKVKQFQLAIRIHRAWNRLALARREYQLQRQIAEFLHRLAALTRMRQKQGVGNQLELQLALASELSATQAVYSAAATYRQRQQQLSALLGWPTPSTLRLRDLSLPTLPSVPSLSRLEQQVLPQHPRIQLVEAARQQGKMAIQWAQAQAIPDLTLSVGYAYEDGAHVVTGGLSIPLPLFWRNQGGIKQQQARLQEAQRLLVAERYQLRQKLLQALTHYRNDLKVLQIFRQRLLSAQKQFKLIEKGLKLGVFTPFQTLTAQRSILDSQLRRLQSISHALSHYLTICQAAGFLPQWNGRKQP